MEERREGRIGRKGRGEGGETKGEGRESACVTVLSPLVLCIRTFLPSFSFSFFLYVLGLALMNWEKLCRRSVGFFNYFFAFISKSCLHFEFYLY